MGYYRKELINRLPQGNAKLVIKLGSLSITHSHGGIDEKKLARIVDDIAELKRLQIQVVIVSSGAVNTGKKYLNEKETALTSVSYLQACSAIGQPLLMNHYANAFADHGMQPAQVLLTHEDLKDRRRFLNLKNTVTKLLENDIIPIINENDSVSFDEITVGDNDQLAASVCQLIDADLLLMLTASDGLFDRDPGEPGARHFSSIAFDTSFHHINLLAKSKPGRGGMKTKLIAVRKVTPQGIPVIIGTFAKTRPIFRLIAEDKGTFFFAQNDNRGQVRKNWIASIVRNHAELVVDQGAFDALTKHASLLPVGIVSTVGRFKRGDVISVRFADKLFAHGISEYDAKDIKKICGRKSSAIFEILGFFTSNVVIHRDNLYLTDG